LTAENGTPAVVKNLRWRNCTLSKKREENIPNCLKAGATHERRGGEGAEKHPHSDGHYSSMYYPNPRGASITPTLHNLKKNLQLSHRGGKSANSLDL